MGNLIANWFSRHRNPMNFWLHVVGIPATVAAVVLAAQTFWLAAAALFVAGYALQFIGHAVEGNSSGEAILARRLMGKGKPAPKKPPARRRRR